MRYLLFILPALLCCCNSKQTSTRTEGKEVSSDTIKALVPAETLTPEQKAEGWKSLFDGKSLSGWRIYQNKENNSWEVKDGALHCKPFDENGENKRSDLISDEEFENFELTFDWKISPQGNSGVMYRVTEEFKEPYQSGPEYQTLDDVGYPGKTEDWQKTGACYALYAPANAKPNPVGDWNASRIIVSGNNVEHWLNGAKVLSYEIGSPEWKKKKSGGKWNDAVGYGAAKKGHIDLQDHVNETWFKNIAIKILK